MSPATAREAAEELIGKRRLRFRFMKHDAWENALFVHWPVEAAVVAALLPRGLEPDVLEGSAWVGLVLLTERGVSAHHPVGRWLVRPIDHQGANVRTYVRRGGVPGIFFWSLECSSLLASLGARLAGIPYFPARMARGVDVERPLAAAAGGGGREGCAPAARGGAGGGCEARRQQQQEEGFSFSFSSVRWRGFGRPASVSARWRLRGGGGGEALPERFLERARWFVERYSVYAAWPLGCGPLLLRGEVQHGPWAVQPAALEALDAEELLAAAGLPRLAGSPGAREPHVCFSRGVGPVEFWMLEPV